MPDKTILALISDLMFATRVENTLGAAGWQVEVLEDAAELGARLRQERPALILVDLMSQGLALEAVLAAAREGPKARAGWEKREGPKARAGREKGESSPAAPIPVLAYGPHMDRGALAAARAAGCTAVLPRSRFAGNMPRAVAALVGPP